MYLLNDSTNHLRRLMINRGASIASAVQSCQASGEQAYFLKDDLKRETVKLVASIWPNPATFFDFLAYFRLLRDNKSPSPSLLIPYLGYVAPCLEPGQAKINEMILEQLRNLNAAKISVFDYHDPSALAKLGPNTENISAAPLLASRINKEDIPEIIMALSPWALAFGQKLSALWGLEIEVALWDKTAKITSAEVKGKRVLLLSNAIFTGQTISEAVRQVSQKGASQIQVAAAHGLFVDEARDKLASLPIKDFFVTNTLPQQRHPAIKVIDISSLLLTLE